MKQYTITLYADDNDMHDIVNFIMNMLRQRTIDLDLNPDHVFRATEGNTTFVMSNPVTEVFDDGFEKRNVTLEYQEGQLPGVMTVSDDGTVRVKDWITYKFVMPVPKIMDIEHPELIARIREEGG